MICGESFSISLQEGICQFGQERIGQSSRVDYYKEAGADIEEQDLLRLAYDSGFPKLLETGILCHEEINRIWMTIGNAGYYPYSPNVIEGTLWYKLSHSRKEWRDWFLTRQICISGEEFEALGQKMKEGQ